MATVLAEQATTMKAALHKRFELEGVELGEIEKPTVPDDRVLVRVRAAALNKIDWYDVTGTPWIARPLTGLRRPKEGALGHDFAGMVEAVGKDVTGLEPGDEVFGASGGSFAEYVTAERARVARKPANLTFEEAAAIPIAALTALQGLRDHGALQAGGSALVNGASGGVGTFAVQIAKALGAEVTAVCSTRNVEQARALGADHVIDYTKEDFTRGTSRHDVILDVAGGKSWSGYRRVLNPNATLVLIGGKGNRLVGPLAHIFRIKVAAIRGSQKAVFCLAKFNEADMDTLRELHESGQVKPVVERVYELDDLDDALRYLGEGHVRSKLVVSV
jgi:NADPH:quinone reductase-like Zn-dependent oxidoreductase